MSRQPSTAQEQDQGDDYPHPRSQKPRLLERGATLLILGFVIVVALVALVLAFYVASPKPAQTTPATSSTEPAIPGNGGIAPGTGLGLTPPAAGANGNDPYASLSREQVMDAFVEAYKAKDFTKCNALISPMVKAGWHSPDELALQVAKQEQENGQLEVLGVGIVPDSDRGNQATFVVQYIRHLPANQPTITPGRSLGGGTVDPTYQATVQARYNQRHSATYNANIEVRREGNAYKIFAYTIF